MRLPPEGWRRIAFDPAILAWVEAVLPIALRLSAADERRHGATWRPGVNLLPNDTTGALQGGPALPVALQPCDAAQLSACLPGYPRQDAGESDAAHRFRRDRDAAHLDGLLPEGPLRRRHLREMHRHILGLPLTDHAADAAPFVIWEGSQEIVRAMLRDHLSDDPRRWGDIDLTDPYQAARREVFATCRRVEIAARPGEGYVAHRLSIHGTAPWGQSDDPQRLIAYFRPHHPDPLAWRDAP